MFTEDLKEVFTLGKDGLKSAYTALSGFALILTIAVALILAVSFAVVYFKAKSKMESFKTLALGILVGYALTIIGCISFFMIARLSVKGELDTNFYLMLGFFALCLVYAISLVITKFANKKAFSICNYIGITLIVAYLIVLICLLPTVQGYDPLSSTGMYIFTALLVSVIAVLTLVFGRDKDTVNPTKALSYAGVCIALSFALSYVKLFSLPQGGSITLASMLPLIIYSYVFGAKKGVLAGIIYGALQCLQSPQIYQPIQVLLDYPLAFAALGVAGIVKNLKFLKTPMLKFIFGASVACVLRYFAHVLSGYYVFSSWAMPGYSAIAWGFIYNLYVIAELAILLVVGVGIFSSKTVVKQLEKMKGALPATEQISETPTTQTTPDATPQTLPEKQLQEIKENEQKPE